MSTPPTIRDIAQALGLSKSTVHRALTGQRGISVETQERVAETARALGYRPDPLYSILGAHHRTTRTKELLVAYLAEDLSLVSNGIDVFDRAFARAAELGYRVERVSPTSIAADKVLMDVLYHRGFVGALLGRVRASDRPLILRNSQIPVVACGRVDASPVHTVAPDASESVRLAWDRAMAAGYRKIGVAPCAHLPSVADDSSRLGAVLARQKECLSPDEGLPPFLGGIGDTDGLVRWAKRHRPEVIIGFGAAHYYFLRDGGIDMNRTAYLALQAEPQGPVAGYIQKLDTLADEAVNLLDQLIRHRKTSLPEEPLLVLIPGVWRDGSSFFPKPAPVRKKR